MRRGRAAAIPVVKPLTGSMPKGDKMILSLFTVRDKTIHQIHKTLESDDIQELIRIGREWENDELSQYYTIREQEPITNKEEGK
jgi:hypothetical protein